jgi:D-3-phosphoglycerate dehydrogenase
VRVLIADDVSPLARRLLAERGIEADPRAGLSAAALKAAIGDYEGLIVRSATKVTADVLAAAGKLKVVGRAGIGVDTIDVDAATQRGVVVMNAPYGNAVTTAEHTIAMLLAVARQIPQANASTRAGKWERARFMGVEVMGKTLGLIGCGNVGGIVAERALGLKMKVIAYDPYLAPERAVQLGVEKVDFDRLLASADFVSLHAPATDATRNMIDAAAIAKMKKGVRIVNCARGGLVVEEDLRAAIERGHVAGAALDVFLDEPAGDNPLFRLEQVVATPHLGASTMEAQEKVAVQIAEAVADYLVSGAVTNAVNMPSVTAEEAAKLRPYLRLAEQIGSFAGQATETAIKAAAIEFEGEAAERNTKALTAAVLKGLLSPLLEAVNFVNAPVVARERKIDVSEIRRERARAYSTLIKLTVTTEARVRGLAGTLFNGEEPRIVEIKGIPVDAKLGRHMLYVTNRDKPGVIGALGTALGEAGVNIASFNLGRAAPGGDAIALIEIDGPAPPEVLARLRGLPNVVQVKAMEF